MTRDKVMRLQSRLTAHGFPVGGIDGVNGPTTNAAIRAFQRAKGLKVDGIVGSRTWAALNVSSSAVPGGFTRPEDRPEQPAHNVLNRFPRQSGVLQFYGAVGTRQTSIEPPWRMRLAWDKRRYIQRMTLHELVADSASEAMKEVYKAYGQEGIRRLGLDMFGGSLNVRKMRGGSAYSMHSWGIAIDFDPERNGLRTRKPVARLSRSDVVRFWEIWEAHGWTSLGRQRDFDWMHVQAARL